MTLLLDTHVFLWWLDDPRLLSKAARKAVGDGKNTVYVSAAVVWEIVIKKALGKLDAPDDLEAAMAANRFLPLPVTIPHALAVRDAAESPPRPLRPDPDRPGPPRRLQIRQPRFARCPLRRAPHRRLNGGLLRAQRPLSSFKARARAMKPSFWPTGRESGNRTASGGIVSCQRHCFGGLCSTSYISGNSWRRSLVWMVHWLTIKTARSLADDGFGDERPRVDNPDATRDEWLTNLQELLAQIRGWAEGSGWRTRVIEKSMKDSVLGQYKAPAMLMQRETVEVILDPVGRFAPGTDGVVDLYLLPAYDDIASLYFVDGAWRLHYAFRLHAVVQVSNRPNQCHSTRRR